MSARAGQGGVSLHRAPPLDAYELDCLFTFCRSTQNRCCPSFSDFVYTFSCISSILPVVFWFVLNFFKESHPKCLVFLVRLWFYFDKHLCIRVELPN